MEKNATVIAVAIHVNAMNLLTKQMILAVVTESGIRIFMKNKKNLLALFLFITTLAISAIAYSWHGRYGYGGLNYGVGFGVGFGGYPGWGWNPGWGYPYCSYYPYNPVYPRYDEEEINRNRDRERYYDRKAEKARQRIRAAEKKQRNPKGVNRREE